MHADTWNMRIDIEEDDDNTVARAVLTGRDGVTVSGSGKARRRSGDAVIPELGEELAVARSLYAVADRLMEAASWDLENLSHPA